MGRPVTTRRTWLDSADWRLYRAGRALTATTGTDATAGRDGRDRAARGGQTLELSSA
jgi:hypothetical protein